MFWYCFDRAEFLVCLSFSADGGGRGSWSPTWLFWDWKRLRPSVVDIYLISFSLPPGVSTCKGYPFVFPLGDRFVRQLTQQIITKNDSSQRINWIFYYPAFIQGLSNLHKHFRIPELIMTYLCRINSHSILTPLISISIDYTQYISALSTANSHSRNTLVLFVCSSIEHNKLCVSMYSSEPTR